LFGIFKTSGSVTAVGLELSNFFSGKRSSLFYHGLILEDTSGLAVLVTSQAEDVILFWARRLSDENWGTLLLYRVS